MSLVSCSCLDKYVLGETTCYLPIDVSTSGTEAFCTLIESCNMVAVK